MLQYFIPHVESDRKLCGDGEYPAILFFDNSSSHIDEELLQIMAENMIIVISYPRHTSYIFQVLDLLLFGIFKISQKAHTKNRRNFT